MTEPENGHDPFFRSLGDLHRYAIRWLSVIILTAIVGLIMLAVADAGIFDAVGGEGEGALIGARGGQTDQAVAILGNIAAAGIGGLVGWFTRDFTIRRHNTEVIAGGDHDVDT